MVIFAGLVTFVTLLGVVTLVTFAVGLVSFVIFNPVLVGKVPFETFPEGGVTFAEGIVSFVTFVGFVTFVIFVG